MTRSFLAVFSILLLLVNGGRVHAKVDTLVVSSQAEFDLFPTLLEDALPDGNVHVFIKPGIYRFQEGHVCLEDLDNPTSLLSISGNNAILIAAGGGDDYDLDYGYVDTLSLRPVDIRHPVRKAGSWPIPVLFRRGVYKIRCDEPDLLPEEASHVRIILSQWFKGAVYPVIRIKGGWLYFKKETDYGVSMFSELRYGRCLPRYILCTPPDQGSLYACKASNFLSVADSKLASVHISGLCFLGNKAGKPLIHFNRTGADSLVVEGCSFSGIKSDGIVIEETDRFRIRECLFEKNYLSCIRVAPGCDVPEIYGNRFLDNGMMMTNAPVVLCQGEHYRIHGNYFRDFSYSAIGIGIHFTVDDIYGTGGVVEDNEICMSEQFRKGVFRELIDAGAIYIWTQNRQAIVRDNYIHDIDGPHGNRGIFADDGAVHTEISGNRVVRIHNGYCIDIRKAFRIQRSSKSKVKKANIGNRIYDNIVDGRVRIFVRDDDPSSFATNNGMKNL